MKRYVDSAIVLKRNDYGERDRILTLLTREHGKVGVIAKGVRSAKSKLAAGIELLSESNVGIVSGKGALDTLTSSRLEHHYGKIVTDINRTMQAYDMLKVVYKLTEDRAGQEYYPILAASFAALDDFAIDSSVTQTWFNLHVLQEFGSAPNLQTDSVGERLTESSTYRFDHEYQCFVSDDTGVYSVDHIKVLRICAVTSRPPFIQTDAKVIEVTSRLTSSLLSFNVAE